MGRRRIWLAGSIIPAALFYIMLYASPVGISPNNAAVWMGIAVFGFYTAMTAVSVPHLSLGAEATQDSYSRNKLFGMRHAMIGVGSILALVTLTWLTNIDPNDSQALRQTSLQFAIFAGLVSVSFVLATAWGFREPDNLSSTSDTTGSVEGVYSASISILKNRNARLLLIVQFIESIGSGALGAAALYVAQYVMGNIGIAPYIIVSYLVMSTVSIPLWVRVSKRIPKVSLWIATMAGSAISYGGLFTLVFFEQGTLQVGVLIALSLISGTMSGCAHTMGPSVLSDIIDENELQTGTRKEGAHFALYLSLIHI